MNTRLTPMLGGLLLTAATLAGCGSGSGYGSNPMSPSPTYSPSPTGTPAVASVTIRIVGQAGNQSFSPNPSSIAAGQTVAFYNADSTAHRIVSDDGSSFDTGSIAPGGTSAPIMLSNAGSFGYHSSSYPAMVGTLTVAGQ
jgi:plastocyanin